ncbi:Hint domain-containing protein [Sulfitobacter sp. HNIBRBA3233]|uniref:Hint domain-containing protein n=1 Tax=Sulfitobacter marinivivus TaxID=3158558 RepID=UPI0032DED5ED
MTTLSFYARGDGASANNAALNVDPKSQQATTLITFDSGPKGDLVLEANGGGVDPDTTVRINGNSYNFKVEQTGDLPIGNGKVPDALEGSQITVISVVINGVYERFFFVTDGSGTMALMDQFGNGAVPLSNVDTMPTEVFICYGVGTDILTPTGYKKVESLQPGDHVMTLDNGAQEILWARRNEQPLEAAEVDAKPVLIKAGALGPGHPSHDLVVSPQHRILVGGQGQLHRAFDAEVFVPAKALTDLPGIRFMQGKRTITWFHFACARHEVVLANGCASESLLLGPIAVQGMTGLEKAQLVALFGTGPSSNKALNGPTARDCLAVRAARDRLYAGQRTPVRLAA